MENPPSDIVPEAVSALLARAKAGDVSAIPGLVECCMSQSHPPDMSDAVLCALRNSLHNPDCMCLLALLHLFGNGLEKNERKAVTYLRRAAGSGQPHAALMLARLKREARCGLKPNPVRELELLHLAYTGGVREAGIEEAALRILSALREQADAKQPDACFRYAEVCQQAFFVPQDFKRAAQYYLLAAEGGHVWAQYELGRCYAEGRGVPKNAAEAERRNRLAAEQGWPPAEYEEGNFYARGNGVPQNDAEAFKWYSRAVKHSCKEALAALGSCYESGKGTARDEQKAIELYTLSMEQECPEGCYQMGVHLLSGKMVEQNIREGVDCLREAASYGHEKALPAVDAVVERLREAALAGDAAAQAELGFLYAEGLLRSETDEAFRWFSLAAEQGRMNALGGLGLCYLNGWGTEPNVKKGRKLLARAAEHGDEDAIEACRRILFTSDDSDETWQICLLCLRHAAERGSERARQLLQERGL